MMRGPSLAAGVLLAVVLTAPPSAAAQLQASDRPTASGPLAYEGKSCVRHTLRADGKKVATTRTCLFLYSFSRLSEVDALRDYGAAWVQTEVDPRGGWCARAIGSAVFLPEEAAGHARAPKARSVSFPKRVTAKLVVDAQGAALADGALSQGFRLYPNRITGSSSDGGRSYTVVWRGRTAKPLAFALGLEFSAPADDILLRNLGSFGAGLVQPLAFTPC